MFENYVITDHAVERYQERMGEEKKNVIKRIRADLHFTKVKRIINEGSIKHVFTRNGKEFVFTKDGNVWVLKTVIKRTRQNHTNRISKKQASVTGGRY